MSVAVATPAFNGSEMPFGNTAHPLDPLSVAEILRACELLKAIKKLGPELRFAMVHLHEPPKTEVLAYKVGEPMERSAFLMVFDAKTGETHEAVVNLTRGTLVSWVQHVTDAPPYGQPPVLVEDFFNCDHIVKADEGWRNAVKRRGLTDEDIKLVQVDPFSAGNFGFPLEAGKRVVRAVSYYRKSLKDNAYSHPIEGVVAVVDLIGKRVLQLVDDEVVIPVPKKKHNYDPESLGKPRGRSQAAAYLAARGTEFFRGRLAGEVAEVELPGRVYFARGAGAAPARFRRWDGRAPSGVPSQRYRDGGSLWRP